MNRIATLLSIVVLASAAVVARSSAQSPNRYGWVYQAFPTGYGWLMPRSSPTASVFQMMGVTEIDIRYSRPSVRGRTVWGELVPYDAAWRAGANEATVISFSTDVTIEGQPLAAGEYALFTVPGAEEWQFIFSNRPHQWGAFGYTEAEDALRVTVRPREANHMEQMQYAIPSVTDTSAYVELRWETLAVGFEVAADTPREALDAFYAAFDWRAAYFAGDYLFGEGANLEEALKWASASAVLDEGVAGLMLKARILAELERYGEAVETAREARAKAPERMHEGIDAQIEEWGG